ncbi:MAG TPA: carboxypeptidase-like regulatory domain-containing protein, partial [Tepidisphaeraceae bacterium]
MPRALLIGLSILVFSGVSYGLIVGGRSTKPVDDNNWPDGSVAVANLPSRVGWIEGPPFGGGEHTFFYQGDAKAMQEALDLFAKVRAPRLELVVHGGSTNSPFLRDEKDPKADDHVDWTLTLWNPQSWYHLYNNPTTPGMPEDPNFHRSLPGPKIDAYISPDGKIDWTKVKVPAGIVVSDERAEAYGVAGPMIRGDVYDMLTSKPVPGAKVTLMKFKPPQEWEQAGETKADDTGHFEMKDVAPGSYQVRVSAGSCAARS